MLEFKDVTISVGDKALFTNLSFMVKEGESLCLTGTNGSGKTTITRAILGFLPVQSGYITMDGELITSYSAEVLRAMMFYLPQTLMLEPYERVADLLRNIFHLRVNRGVKDFKSLLLEQWQSIGICADMFDKSIKELDIKDIRLIVLSTNLVLKKPVVLVDAPMSQHEISLLQMIAGHGAAVIIADNYGVSGDMTNIKIDLNNTI